MNWSKIIENECTTPILPLAYTGLVLQVGHEAGGVRAAIQLHLATVLLAWDRIKFRSSAKQIHVHVTFLLL